MERYDHIVVGSGISGLTATLLLARQGRKVLLLEKAPRIGGSMARFARQGIPFDTGFHFTGAFGRDGILADMLAVLGIRDLIEPVFLSEERANRFVFEREGRTFDIPCGTARLQAALKREFPGEIKAVETYFDMVAAVCRKTSSLNLRTLSVSPEPLDEDYVSLQTVLDGLTGNALLKAILSGFCMCYGVKPEEMPFASHSRICQGLYESVARIRDGGDAFIRAFQARFRELPVAVRCGTWIEECLDIRDDQVGRFRLNTGEEVGADTCVFTIHPKLVLDVLPRERLSRAFIERVSAFEASAGFFSVFAALDGPGGGADEASIVSLFSTPDMNAMLDPRRSGDSALVIIRSAESVNGRPVCAIHAFEPSFGGEVALWTDTRTGRRGPEYEAYKAARVTRMRERMAAFSPEYGAGLRILDSASLLTFRDYLHSPDGSAYGIKQKVGQFNLFGKLPLRNLYAAGQSAVLPGLLGAMMSAFIVARAIIGKKEFEGFVDAGLRG